MHNIFSMLDGAIATLQTWAYVDLVQPVLYRMGLMSYDEDSYDALYWVIVSALQVAIAYALLRPLEARRPVESWSDRKAARPDILYTWITKLGLINIVFFFMLHPVFDRLQSLISIYGIPSVDLSELWPGITDKPIVSFCIYLVCLDFAGYWYHRWQHRFAPWWELHAVHHSQRQLSLWSDDRHHFIDDILQAAFFSALALFIGVEPTQYVVLVAVGNFLQSLQHANARVPFGRLLERLIVSPAFHRHHHAISPQPGGERHGCNFGVLLPWWDMLLGTAVWNQAVQPTGIREQLAAPEGCGRSYGEGLWAQQWRALGRIAALNRRLHR